jgi:hypothetical protein
VVSVRGRGGTHGGAYSLEKAPREEEEGWNERTLTGLRFLTFTDMQVRCRGVLRARGQPCDIPPLTPIGHGVV